MIKKYSKYLYILIVLIIIVFLIIGIKTKKDEITLSTNKEDNIIEETNEDELFSKYYLFADKKLKSMSLDEKIGQILLARYNGETALEDIKKYSLSGFIMYEKDFKDKSKDDVINMIKKLQNNSKIPLIIGVDEEGGKVVRVSSNPLLVENKFKSSQELYSLGGFDEIRKDTINKSKILSDLGINLNLAPVVDVSTDPSDYMYERSLGKSAELTKEYAKTVIEASKLSDVSYTLKHFPGYGNNIDTHNGIAIDNRTYESIMNNDIPPFVSGIKAKAEVILVSHNIVTSIDSNNPASLSLSIHELLREKLNFAGIILTDDLDMGATSNIEDASVKAVLAGNNLIITTNYKDSFNSIKNAINNNTITEEDIDALAHRVLSWKYYKGLIIENNK